MEWGWLNESRYVHTMEHYTIIKKNKGDKVQDHGVGKCYAWCLPGSHQNYN